MNSKSFKYNEKSIKSQEYSEMYI